MKTLNKKNFNGNPEVVVRGNSELFVTLVDEAQKAANAIMPSLNAVCGNKFRANDFPALMDVCNTFFHRIASIQELMNAGCYYIDVVPKTSDDPESEV